MNSKNMILKLATCAALICAVIFATQSHQAVGQTSVRDQQFGVLPRPVAKRPANMQASPTDPMSPTKHAVDPAAPLVSPSPGSLDLTFSGDGKVTTPITHNYDAANAIAIQSDGKIVVVGVGQSNQFCLARYTTNGELDSSFDVDGRVETTFGGVYATANAVAIQTDGKIVVAGWSHIALNSDFTIARFNTDGSLDTSFDTDGKVTTDVGLYDGADAIAIQTDGKIVIGGQHGQGFDVLRYNTNGSLDTTFDGDGIVTTPVDELGLGFVNAVAIQADGKIIAAGGSGTFKDSVLTLVRYNANGSLDTSFDADGIVTSEFGTANDVAIQADGKIVVAAGFFYPGFAVARFNIDGSPDTSFDGDGRVTTSFDGYPGSAFAVAIQANGRIVAAGSRFDCDPFTCFDHDFGAVRYNADGSLDTSFSFDGKLTTDFNDSEDVAKAIAIQSDGKIAAAGSTNHGPKTYFALTRYTVDGQLDVYTFGHLVGKVSTAFAQNADSAKAVKVQVDGKIVTAGQASNAFALVRYKRDGILDPTFGTNGKVTTSSGPGYHDAANALAIQPDGKLVAAGYSVGPSDYSLKFAVIRYNTNGSLDTSFGPGGIVTRRIGLFDSSAQSVLIQPDGKIVAGGYADDGITGQNFALLRLNSNGSIDESFGFAGVAITDIEKGQDSISGIVIQSDGKLVAAGFTERFTSQTSYFALARYNTDGSPDTSFGMFGHGGTLITDFGNRRSTARAIALQPDGKIIAAGQERNTDLDYDFALARYNSDGSLDMAFDGDGLVIAPLQYTDDSAASVAVQSNGKIVAAGYASGLSGFFSLARFESNGTLDNRFGTNGRVDTGFGNSSAGYAVAIQPNGMIVAAGAEYDCRGSYCSDVALARYIGDTRSMFDYDGDRRADISVFRPSDRVWYLNQSTAGFSAVQFGVSTDKIAPADFDGDDKTDIAVYRPETAVWYWLNSSDGAFHAVQFGTAEDLPTPADYDGDGRADISVFRPSNRTWYRLNSSDGSFYAVQFGLSEDKPTIGDYDGDGRADLAVFRPSTGAWYRRNSSNGAFVGVYFGISTDLVTPADFDGDGKTDIAVYRPSTGVWYWLNSSNGAFNASQFGIAEDIPSAADFDGDGRADISAFRPYDGNWYRLNSSNGAFVAYHFGLNGDRPTPSAFTF